MVAFGPLPSHNREPLTRTLLPKKSGTPLHTLYEQGPSAAGENKMELGKYSLRAAVWLLALAAVILAFKVNPTVAHAANMPVDAVAGQPSVTAFGAKVVLPPIEEFIVTPPNPDVRLYKTTLSLRFAERSAERLSPLIPIALGSQNVMLRRSSDDPGLYSAVVDFNWEGFAHEQARRQQLDAAGTQVPVFQGHRLLGTEPMQFVDPEQIRQALQSHQPIRFTSRVLMADPGNIIPDHELMINSISVVEDATRTWDPCTQRGKQMGAWTFGALVTAIANDDPSTHLVADQMVQSWLDLWTAQQNVNHFPVSFRFGMLGVLRNWRLFAQDKNGLVDVSQAPFQLNAIVNRIDLSQPSNPAGELRFVFGYAPCPGGGAEGKPATFNVILEYRVPLPQCSYAEMWHNLDLLVGSRFNPALQAITDQVVTSGASQNLSQVRTNENFTSQFAIWEQRQFMLSLGALIEVPVPQTPNGDNAAGRIDFNATTCTPNSDCRAGVLTDYINQNQQDILDNNYTVPLSFPSPDAPFLGGSALNGPLDNQLVYWQSDPPPNRNDARSIFSQNTCNGCHGRETFVHFRQIENRQAGPPGISVPAPVSAFLVGCSTSSQGHPLNDQTGPCPPPPTNACTLQNTLKHDPPCISWVQDPGDPSGNTVNQFAELSRRAQMMSSILNGCSSDGALQSLLPTHLSSGH